MLSHFEISLGENDCLKQKLQYILKFITPVEVKSDKKLFKDGWGENESILLQVFYA